MPRTKGQWRHGVAATAPEAVKKPVIVRPALSSRLCYKEGSRLLWDYDGRAHLGNNAFSVNPMNGSECGRDQQGFGCDTIYQNLCRIQY